MLKEAYHEQEVLCIISDEHASIKNAIRKYMVYISIIY